jgi:ubiquinone/menaquinone biosynthesis C-methylase UbiE
MNGWRYFFDEYAPKYKNESYVKNTTAEVDFLLEELNLPAGSKILDIGCGTGRHSLELARRGFQITGIDISQNMLKEAKKVRDREELPAKFICADAVDFSLNEKFDGCICLCEGAFGLLSSQEDPFTRDFRILRNIYRVLHPQAKFVLTALNGLRMIRKYSEKDVDEGRFDPVGIVEIYPLQQNLANAPADIMIKEKGFLATELKLMLEKAGFTVENIWGGTAGSWNRQRLLMDEIELMVISQKGM